MIARPTCRWADWTRCWTRASFASGDYEHRADRAATTPARCSAPYVAGLLVRRRERHRVAVVLHDARLTDKLAQTLLEMVRGGVQQQPVDLVVFCETAPATRS